MPDLSSATTVCTTRYTLPSRHILSFPFILCSTPSYSGGTFCKCAASKYSSHFISHKPFIPPMASIHSIHPFQFHFLAFRLKKKPLKRKISTTTMVMKVYRPRQTQSRYAISQASPSRSRLLVPVGPIRSNRKTALKTQPTKETKMSTSCSRRCRSSPCPRNLCMLQRTIRLC